MGLEAATIGLIISGIGAGTAVYGQVQAAEQKDVASEASQKAEAARKRQAELEEAQRRRQLIRQAIIARSTALSNATAQGAGGGSGFFGTATSYGSQFASNIGNLNQSSAIRDDIFAANATYSQASASAQNYGALAEAGGDIFASSEKLGKLFTNIG